MLVVYDSKTGNVERFVDKLRRGGMFRFAKITEQLKASEPFVLITYTTGMGQVPESTSRFLERSGEFIRGVVASGNMNWGTRFGLAGDHIAEAHTVPLLMKFELSGTTKDIQRFYQEVDRHVSHVAQLVAT